MFEQSLLIENPSNKQWSVLVSLGGQMLFIGAAMLVPLIFSERISTLSWVRTFVMAPQAPPLPMARVERVLERVQTAAPRLSTEKVFTAPARVPNRIATIVDAPTVPVLLGAIPGAVPGGTGALVNMIRNAAPVPAPPPPAVQPEQTRPIRISEGVQMAMLVRRVVPVYPALAKQARISGTVRLVGVIGRDGTIQNLQLISGPPLLVSAALEAVRQWVYRPTLLNGKPVEVIAPIDVVFTLSQ